MVTGMGCQACSAKVEAAVSALEGVDVVAVSLLTHSMQVEGSIDADSVCRAVIDAGYGCEPA